MSTTYDVGQGEGQGQGPVDERHVDGLSFGRPRRRGPRNRLLDELRELELAPNGTDKRGTPADRRHIPDMYLFNSRAIRLQLLAGLLDSDGHYHSVTDTFIFPGGGR